jgi:hypothetical protein
MANGWWLKVIRTMKFRAWTPLPPSLEEVVKRSNPSRIKIPLSCYAASAFNERKQTNDWKEELIKCVRLNESKRMHSFALARVRRQRRSKWILVQTWTAINYDRSCQPVVSPVFTSLLIDNFTVLQLFISSILFNNDSIYFEEKEDTK